MSTQTSPAENFGLGSFFGGLAQTLNDAARYRLIDREIAIQERDTAEAAAEAAWRAQQISQPAARETFAGSPLRDTLAAMAPWQWAGLAVAAALTWGLVTGKFR